MLLHKLLEMVDDFNVIILNHSEFDNIPNIFLETDGYTWFIKFLNWTLWVDDDNVIAQSIKQKLSDNEENQILRDIKDDLINEFNNFYKITKGVQELLSDDYT